MINWNDIYFFVSLVEQGTLTATSQMLGVRHTTVARRIEQLETALGIKLFHHMGKRYLLSEAGQQLYEQATKVKEEMEKLQRIAINQNLLQGEVTLSAPPVLANEMILPFLADFYRLYPEIILHLHGETRTSNLYQREADIALRLQYPSQQDFALRKLTDISYHFFSATSDIDTLPFIAFSASNRLTNWLNSICEQDKKRPIGLFCNDLYAVKKAIMQSIGIGILPSFMVQESDGLVPVNPLDCATMWVQQSPLYLVMHADVRHAGRVRAVADWLLRLFQR